MGEVVQLISRSERERGQLIRRARAIYDSIFPSSAVVNDQQHMVPASHAVIGVNAYRGDGGVAR